MTGRFRVLRGVVRRTGSPGVATLMCHPEPAGEGSRPSVAPADASKLSLFPLHRVPSHVVLSDVEGARRHQPRRFDLTATSACRHCSSGGRNDEISRIRSR